jgi:hypothetical protein
LASEQGLNERARIEAKERNVAFLEREGKANARTRRQSLWGSLVATVILAVFAVLMIALMPR